MIIRRTVLAQSLLGAALSALPCYGKASSDFSPEQFGAKGDGHTDDTEAFILLSRAVERAGGGRIIFSPRTYMVGRQSSQRLPNQRFEPSPIINLEGLAHGITIEGNGAVLRTNPRGRYGSFDVAGKALHPRMPFFDGNAIASPYRFMIRVARSKGPTTIRNLELDGNLDHMILGGQWGDVGWQVSMTGIGLFDNLGDELLSDLYLHDHGQDGLLIDGTSGGVSAARRIERVRCIGNGRQGCSVVGGRGYRFKDCQFSRTGRGPVASAPGAGVDLEAEGGKQIRDIVFVGCLFDDNYGAGMVADSGPSSEAFFLKCTFVGTTNWSAWPSKPSFRFERCVFAGAVVRAFASSEASLATQFVDCRFTDRHPTSGKAVYGSDGTVPMVDLGGSFQAGLNVAFIRCFFDFRSGGKLPWTAGSIFDSVKMIQASAAPSYPRGVYRGHSTISGPAVLASTRVEGSLTLNGRAVH